MHIAFLTNEYPPLPTGGIGTNVRNLARAMTKQGHRVSVIGWGKSGTWQDQKVEITMLPETRLPKMGWWLNRKMANDYLTGLVRNEGLQIVEAGDWCGLSAGMRPGCPIVIRMNGSDTYFGHLLNEPVRRSVWLAEWLALHRADSLCSVSSYTGEVTRRLFKLKQPITVIPNGIDISKFQPAETDDSDPDTILYFGTLVRKKGVLDLCRIFSLVVERYPAAHLLLVGRDSRDKFTDSPSTWGLCQELLSPQALKRAEYLGAQPYEKVQEYVKKATICVFPSYAEALPLSWLEAMACAKPVVAYNIGWAPEVIENGISGRLVPLGDTEAFARILQELLENSDRRYMLGDAARRQVEAVFSSHVVAEKTVKWYKEIVKAYL